MQKLLGKTVADRMTAFDVYSFLNVLPNPDPILARLGRRISAYDDLLHDSQVGSCMASRKAGISKLNFELEAGSAPDNVKNFIRDTFKEIKTRRLFKMILDCVAYGYQPIEINWEARNGHIVPVLIEEKPAEWFCFSDKNELRFLSKKSPVAGEELPEMKFVCPTLDSTYKNPYGISVLSKCFWPVAFKKGGLKFWVSFVEKYGTPWLIARYAKGTSKADQNELEDKCVAAVQDAVLVIPESSKIEIIEAAGKSASSDVFEKLKDTCNAEISKAILGQTLTTELTSTGSLAAAQTHNEVRKDIIIDDAKIIEETVNQIVRWTVDQNFGKNVPAPEFHFYEPENVDKQLAERDAILSGIGVRFTPEYIQKAYNLGKKDFTIVDPGGGLFSSSSIPAGLHPAPQDSLDRAAARAFPPELQQKIIEGLLKPVFTLIENGESLEEIYEKLGELLPELNTEQLQDVLERACSAADMFGRGGGKI